MYLLIKLVLTANANFSLRSRNTIIYRIVSITATFFPLYALVLIMVFMPTFLYGADEEKELVEKYSVAHEAKNIEALRALVYWDGASERTREIIQKRLILHLNLEIDNIEFRPLTGDEEFKSLDYRPNLEPVGWLAMFFKPPKEDSRFIGKSFVVGEKDGKYFITVAEPAH